MAIVFSTAAFAIMGVGLSRRSISVQTRDRVQARYAAEAGVVRAMSQLWADPAYCGEPDPGDPGRSEHIERALGVARKELQQYQIERSLQCPCRGILPVAMSVCVRILLHWDLGDPCTSPVSVNWDETVQVAVELHSYQRFAPIGLEGAFMIVQRDLGNSRDQKVD